VLQNNILYYCKGKNEEVAGNIEIENSVIKSAFNKTGRKFSFEIETKDRTYFLVADNQSDMEGWISVLNRIQRLGKSTDTRKFTTETIVFSIQGMMCDHCEVYKINYFEIRGDR